MQPKLLIVGAVLISQYSLLTYGRAFELPRSEVSTTILSDRTNAYHDVEPRAFRAIKKIMDDRTKAGAGRKDSNEGDDTPTIGASGGSNLAPPKPPPAKYIGPVPNGMNQEPQLSEWNRFLNLEIEYGRGPPETGGYLLYSGTELSSKFNRNVFKDMAEEDPNVGRLHDWHDVYDETPAATMWNHYPEGDPLHHLASFAISFAQARRVAKSQKELHMVFDNADEPLMHDKSFWAAVEAGIVTGPDSEVTKIWRYNFDEVKVRRENGEPLPKPTLVWQRGIHQPFGKRIDELDWRIDPKADGQPDTVMKTALYIEPPPQLGPFPFEKSPS